MCGLRHILLPLMVLTATAVASAQDSTPRPRLAVLDFKVADPFKPSHGIALAAFAREEIQKADSFGGIPMKRNFAVAVVVTVGMTSVLPTTARSGEGSEQKKTEPPEALVLDLGGGVTMELVLIPAGEFLMGSPQSEEERASDEGPQHRVRIAEPFYMGRYEVTVGQFRRFVDETGYRTDAEKGGESFEDGKRGGYTVGDDGFWRWRESASWRNPGFPQNDNHPVVLVSWNDAQGFCEWLAGKTGRPIRLPSEAQWEYACRGGTSTAYWWGDGHDRMGKVANVADRRAKSKYYGQTVMGIDDGYADTAPVGTYRANGFGLHDMIGNVWEWCEDVWHHNYVRAPRDGSAWTNGGDQDRRVLRGGSWLVIPSYCRSAIRGRDRPDYRDGVAGFRVAAETR